MSKSSEPSFTLSVGERALSIAWVVVFFAGMVALFARTQAMTTDLSGVAIPCCLLIAYAAYGLRVKNRNTAKFADSVYFMGFLWTLTALIDAVVAGEIDAGTVFQAFGYALVTTGLGMFLRTTILQFHTTIPDQLDYTQTTLDTQLHALARELGNANDEIARVTQQVPSSLQSQLDHIGTKVKSVCEAMDGFHAAQSELTLAKISESSDAIDQRMTANAQAATNAVDSLRAASQGLDGLPATVSRLSTVIAELETNLHHLGAEINDLTGTRVAEAVAHLDTAEATIQDVQHAGTQLGNAVKEVSSFLRRHLGNNEDRA